MTRTDKVRLAVSGAASMAAMIWFASNDRLMGAAVVALITAASLTLAGRR